MLPVRGEGRAFYTEGTAWMKMLMPRRTSFPGEPERERQTGSKSGHKRKSRLP